MTLGRLQMIRDLAKKPSEIAVVDWEDAYYEENVTHHHDAKTIRGSACGWYYGEDEREIVLALEWFEDGWRRVLAIPRSCITRVTYLDVDGNVMEESEHSQNDADIMSDTSRRIDPENEWIEWNPDPAYFDQE